MVKKKQSSSGGTPATVALEKANAAFTVHAYAHDPASELGYGEEAAQALGTSPTGCSRPSSPTWTGR